MLKTLKRYLTYKDHVRIHTLAELGWKQVAIASYSRFFCCFCFLPSPTRSLLSLRFVNASMLFSMFANYSFGLI
jgi:hypothetical protein